MIPRETVDRIIQAADVVEVISDFITLKKRGASLMACCPFHGEKTPSFHVSASRQIYKCFGCGKGGDAVRFVMDMESLSYPEALKYVARKYNIEVEEKTYSNEELEAQNERESLYIALEHAQKRFEEQLWQTEEGQSIGLSYFKERGFSESTIRKFGLGYALDKWDGLTKEAVQQGFKIDILEKAGLSILKEGKDPIDRFRGRVVFPIHNVSGKPIAFGARILKKDPNAPKYLNSPESDVYHKSNIVYGISFAKKSIKNEDECFLVEGYTDVVSLAQGGIENVVASSGTSLTVEQIRLVRRFTRQITVLYDGDAAGIRASLRGIDLILEEDMNVKAVVFPDGDDPDSYIQKVGTTAFKDYIKANAKDFISFKTELLLADVGTDPIKKAGLITELVSSVAKVPDAIKRNLLTKQVADMMALPEELLIVEGNKLRTKQLQEKEKEYRREQSGPPDDFPPPFIEEEAEPKLKKDLAAHSEEEICRLLMLHGNTVIDTAEDGSDVHLADFILSDIEDIEDFKHHPFDQLINIFRSEMAQGNIPNHQWFLHHPEVNLQEIAINWLNLQDQISTNWLDMHDIYVPPETETMGDHLFRTLLRLRFTIGQKGYKKMQESDLSNPDNLKLLVETKKELNALAEKLGTVVV